MLADFGNPASMAKTSLFFVHELERERARPPAFYRGSIDFAELVKLDPVSQFAEVLAEGYSVREAGEMLGFAHPQSANATLQKIRRRLGKQAI